jgi:hypothetical protein
MRLLFGFSIILVLTFHAANGFVSPCGSVVAVKWSLYKNVENSGNSLFHQNIYNTYKPTQLNLVHAPFAEISSLLSSAVSLDLSRDQAEALAGPFFGASLFPYLAFLYFLKVDENETPKGVIVGFATCLLFVFLTIPAAIAAQLLYGVSLADSDWLHGSAESLLTITNLVTVVAFRQALSAMEGGLVRPASATSWSPMTLLVAGLTAVAIATAVVPAASGATIHTPYLAGLMDLPFSFESYGARAEPENALTVAT